jgi:hypothetical protein
MKLTTHLNLMQSSRMVEQQPIAHTLHRMMLNLLSAGTTLLYFYIFFEMILLRFTIN